MIGMLASDQEAGCRGWKAEGCPGWGVIQAPAGTRCLWLDVSWQRARGGKEILRQHFAMHCAPLLCTPGHTESPLLWWQDSCSQGCSSRVLPPSQACRIPCSASAWFQTHAQKAETNTTSLLFPHHEVSKAYTAAPDGSPHVLSVH